MKITLIEPPYRYVGDSVITREEANSSFPFVGVVLNKNQEMVHLPGVAYVGAMLKNQDHDIKILDFKNTDSRLEDALDSDIIGLSSTISCYSFFKKALPLFKDAGKKIVVGGPFISSYGTTDNLMMRTFPEIDYAVTGEGELTMPRLVEHIRNPSNQIPPGVLLRDKGKIISTGVGEIVQNLDDLPVVDYDDWLGVAGNAKDNAFTAVFSRGCYNHCSFCYNPSKGIRSFSFDRIDFELGRIAKLKPEMVMFEDITFSYDRDRTIKIASLTKKHGLEYSIMTRVNDVDYEMLKVLKETGCRHILLGIESFDDNILKRANKNITVNQIYDAIVASQKASINPIGFMLIGLPGENKKSLENTIKHIRETRIIPRPRLVIPLPGTKIYQDALKAGKIDGTELLKNFSETQNYDTVGGDWVPINLTDDLSDQDLLDARDEMNRLKEEFSK